MKSHLNITITLSEHLKYLRNVCCAMTNCDKDQETQVSHKTVSYFFSLQCNNIPEIVLVLIGFLSLTQTFNNMEGNISF